MKNVSKVSALALLKFDALEQGLEVAGTEALVVATLDDLDEHGRAVLERFRENLEKIFRLIIHERLKTQLYKTFLKAFKENEKGMKLLRAKLFC